MDGYLFHVTPLMNVVEDGQELGGGNETRNQSDGLAAGLHKDKRWVRANAKRTAQINIGKGFPVIFDMIPRVFGIEANRDEVFSQHLGNFLVLQDLAMKLLAGDAPICIELEKHRLIVFCGPDKPVVEVDPFYLGTLLPPGRCTLAFLST